MKEKFQRIAGIGLPYGIVFFGLSFLLGYLFHVDTKNTFFMAAAIGTAAFLLNGMIYSRFSKPTKLLEQISVTLADSETLLLQAAANHRIEETLVPGKLFLTNNRLVFKPFATQENRHSEYSWPLFELRPINFYGTIWNAGGEFLMKTENECRLMFEVDKLRVWKEALKGEIGSQLRTT
jgi:hypothetical protein